MAALRAVLVVEGILRFIPSTAQTTTALTREAFNEAVKKAFAWGRKVVQPLIVSRRQYEYMDQLAIDFGVKQPGEPLTREHWNRVASELAEWNAFERYLLRMGWRP